MLQKKLFSRVNIEDALPGKVIPITQNVIDDAGYDERDNPITNTIRDICIQGVDVGICMFDEAIKFWVDGYNYVPKIYTTTALEDWYKDYINEEKVEPIGLDFFHRDYDDVVENFQPDLDDEDDMETVSELQERVWVGIIDS